MLEIEFDAGPVSAWLQTRPSAIRSGMKRALRRVGTAVQGSAIEIFRQRGVGRSLFGQKPSGARKLISRSKLREREGEFVQPIKLKGLAAIQEKGGRTRAHVIRAREGGRLSFRIGGKPIFIRQVRHPGSNMPAIPFAQRAASRHVGLLAQEMDKELARVVEPR